MSVPSSPTSPELHHPSLYHEDGDIVLAAQTKDGRRQFFRTHRSRLSRQSEVLATMLSLPLVENEEELYDGATCVEMPDHAEDLADLLDVLHDRRAECLRRLDPNTPYAVEGILRLADKYQFEDIRRSIASELEHDWPQDLASWDSQIKEVGMMEQDHLRSNDGKVKGQYLDDRLPEPAAAIRVGITYDLPSILPIAFYRLAILDPHADWDSYRRIAENDPNSTAARYLANGERTAKWDLLNRKDILMLLRGRAELLAYTLAIQKRVIAPEYCANEFNGSMMCLSTRHALREAVEQPEMLYDPLAALAMLVAETMGRWKGKICFPCDKRIKASAKAMRVEVWKKLPDIFRVY